MELNFTSQKSPEFIFEALTDMQKFVKIHPVIYRIDELGGNNYHIYETLRLAFILFSFSYPATVTGDVTKLEVSMSATVMRFTKIEMLFTIRQLNGHTTIVEQVAFRSVLPVKSVLCRIFRKQHTLLFRNLEALHPS